MKDTVTQQKQSVVLTWYICADEVTTSLQDVIEADVCIANLYAVFIVLLRRRFTHQREPQTATHNMCTNICN